MFPFPTDVKDTAVVLEGGSSSGIGRRCSGSMGRYSGNRGRYSVSSRRCGGKVYTRALDVCGVHQVTPTVSLGIDTLAKWLKAEAR